MRFLKFGLLAWGGPIAQIAMIKEELVISEKWITPERFNRVLAVYQVLPGPEATELCVYFGMLKRGRLGGIIAGFAFFLPGFILMLLFSWLYFTYGTNSIILLGVFYGFQPAVLALIIRAIHRIGEHVLKDIMLWVICIFSFIAQLIGVNFFLILIPSGLIYFLYKKKIRFLPILLLIFFLFVVYSYYNTSIMNENISVTQTRDVSFLELLYYGFRTGLLTFGGAYTAIPFLQHDAVITGGWMTNLEFLDGIALSSILPAPLIIFSTFVGYAGGGFPGAVLMTFGVFLPAFLFTLIGHTYLEKVIENKSVHSFLDGVTAGVIGLIAGSAIIIAQATLQDITSIIILLSSLLLLYLWKSRLCILIVIAGAGLAGIILRSYF